VIFLSIGILNNLISGELSFIATLSNIPAQHEPSPSVGAYNSKYDNEKIEFSLPRGKFESAVASIRLDAPRKIVSIPFSRYGFVKLLDTLFFSNSSMTILTALSRSSLLSMITYEMPCRLCPLGAKCAIFNRV
jgi:hypothetical protein